MKFLGSLILFILFLSRTYGLGSDYVFERISPEAGFTFDAITTVVEDNDGFIWFGCNNGLYYYNSVEIVRYNYDPQRMDSPQSNKINKLYKDSSDKIWVCTENGICYFNPEKNSFTRLDLKEPNNYQKYIFATYILQYTQNEYLVVLNNSLFHFDLDEQILKPIKIGDKNRTISISYLGKNNDGQIYIGTSQGEVFVNNSDDFKFNLIYKSKTSSIKTICQINSILWIGYDTEGVDLVDLSGKLISSYRMEYSGDKKLPNNRVRKIIQRKNGDIWIGTFSGIFVITQNGSEIIKESIYNKLPHNSIYDLFLDKNDGVWVGSWSGGLAFYSEYNFRFEHVQKFTNWLNTPQSVISSFAESLDGNIWVGSESLGLNEYNLTTRSFDINMFNPDEKPNLRIKSLASDKNNRLWIGTFDGGLWYLDKTDKKRIQPINNRTFPMFVISSITPDDKGVWIGTRDKLFYYDFDTKQINIYKNEELKLGSISSDKIWKTYIDSKKNLWICTDFGLSLKRKGSDDFERFFQNENVGSLGRNIVYTICEDGEGKMWIGTNGGGIDIYNPEKKSFEKFDLNETLNKADIYSIIKDRHNNMWFSTNIGIHVYMPEYKILKSFDQQDGLQGMQYNPNSAFINSTGQLFWGGSNGFNRIDPETIRENPIVPEVFISKFLINNLDFSQQKIKSLNSYLVAKLSHVELKYNQNSLVFSFVSNNFIKSSKNQFRYRLKNYQDEWTETSFGKDVAFTKIPSGEYILEVFGSNNDGVWSTKPKQLFVKIYPPILLSWYAYLLYFLIAGIILTLLMKEIIFRERVRKEIISERFKREADEMLFLEKTRFFTNVSHEFRTPLTLIISPLNNLMKKFKNDVSTLEQFKTIKRNADRLLRLTNQMLDFRLLELGKIKMKPDKHDIVILCKEICECFDYQIIDKELNFIFTSSFKIFDITIDSDMIEKVVYNLLSNALKFSPEKGQVMLSIEQKLLDESSYDGYFLTGSKFTGNTLEIKVKDFGKGIDAPILHQIFDRFFMNPDNQETGTGIGLHLCQEYIRLHDGNILVTTEPGYGTTFIINLPVIDQLNFEKGNIIMQSHFEKQLDVICTNQSDFNPLHRNKVVLLAEDNDELRIYLKNFLMGGFKVLTAKNGNQAFEIATEVIPDLIISDILMPGMDGLQLTSQIRKNSKTSHIPVILLTALSGNNVQMESINMGADLFLTKPIDESLLLAQIENILANRDNLIEKYGTGNVPANQKGNKISFIERAEKYILDNIRNEQLDINMLANELNISRSSLHRKIKTETNQSSTEFIRDIRLKYAIRLMNDKVYNMDEIAVLTGFNSTSWFNRCFKQKYGKTPKEYKNERKNY